MKTIVLLFKIIRKLSSMLMSNFFTPTAKLFFTLNGVKFGKNLRVYGLIKVFVTRRGEVEIGHGLRINSGTNYNIIGRQQKCIIWVEGKLSIGNNVGISSSALICNHQISIGDNVVIGGNTVIYDTDFHSLDPQLRCDREQDRRNAKWAPVSIGDNVFIGAHSTILKGVTIGNNAIVGACSVVVRDVPAGEIWAGNPAVCVRQQALASSAK